jgi:chaperone protein clpB|nr:MAG TPA: ATP-dependent chaperone [Inoviridae sp.]
MNFNKLTIKASEAIQEANSLCSNRGNNQILPEHLFFAMIEQTDGYLPVIIKKL